MIKAGSSTRSNRLLRTRLQTKKLEASVKISSSKTQFIRADCKDDESHTPPVKSKRPRTLKAEAAEYLATLRKKASRSHNPEVFQDNRFLASTSSMSSLTVSKKVTKGLLIFLGLIEEFIISSFMQDSKMLPVLLLKSRCLPLMKTQNMMKISKFWRN